MRKTQRVHIQRIIQGWKIGYRKPASGEYIAVETDHQHLSELLHHFAHPQIVGCVTGLELEEILRRLKPSEDADTPRWAKAVAATLVALVMSGFIFALDAWGVKLGLVQADSSAARLLDPLWIIFGGGQ